jgi:hypothetical protein
MKKLVCVIVTYLSKDELLRDAIDSFLNDSKEFLYELHIVDNSPIESEALRNFNYPSVQYHFNLGVNKGYGSAINQILNHTEFDFFVIQNPDTKFLPGTLPKLVERLTKDPEIGLVAPKVVSPDGKLQTLNHRNPDLSTLLIRRFGNKKIKEFYKNKLEKYDMIDVGYDNETEVEFLSGSFLVGRRESWRSVNGFDPRFKLYFEDADLCRMVNQKGFKTIYFPDVVIQHHWGRGQYKSFKLMSYFAMSMIKYFMKWGWKI